MTQMNPQLRDELTQLLADHLQEKFTISGRPDLRQMQWHSIAEVAMDFIYGSDDAEEVVEPRFDTDVRVEGMPTRNPCRCGRCGGPGYPAVEPERDRPTVPLIVEAPASEIEELMKDYASGLIMGSSLTGVMFVPSELVFPVDADGRDPKLLSELYGLPQESGRDGSSPSPQTPAEEA